MTKQEVDGFFDWIYPHALRDDPILRSQISVTLNRLVPFPRCLNQTQRNLIYEQRPSNQNLLGDVQAISGPLWESHLEQTPTQWIEEDFRSHLEQLATEVERAKSLEDQKGKVVGSPKRKSQIEKGKMVDLVHNQFSEKFSPEESMRSHTEAIQTVVGTWLGPPDEHLSDDVDSGSAYTAPTTMRNSQMRSYTYQSRDIVRQLQPAEGFRRTQALLENPQANGQQLPGSYVDLTFAQPVVSDS